MVDNGWGMVHWGSMVNKGCVMDRCMVENGGMVDAVSNMGGSMVNRVMGSMVDSMMGSMVGAMETIMLEGPGGGGEFP